MSVKGFRVSLISNPEVPSIVGCVHGYVDGAKGYYCGVHFTVLDDSFVLVKDGGCKYVSVYNPWGFAKELQLM